MAAIELPRLKSKQNLVIKKERTRIININSSKLEEIIYSIWPEVAIAANFCGKLRLEWCGDGYKLEY